LEYREKPAQQSEAETAAMKKRYDFSQSKPNPYVKKAKRQVTIRLDESTIDYFKGLAIETGIPYQNLINLYLRNCAADKRRLKLDWAA
jgi:predicted DNA binding CopG/RHH family protein